LGLAPGVVFSRLTDLVPGGVQASTGVASVVSLRLPGSGGFPSVGIFVALMMVAGGFTWLRGRRAAAPAPTWACGQVVEPQLNWTSSGFSKPLRLVLRGILRPQRQVTVRTQGGVIREVTHWGLVPQLIDDRIYRPVVRWSAAFSDRARLLQSGSLGRYVTYLIGLIMVLLGAVRIGVLG
jgi:hydrogenase-4 component B